MTTPAPTASAISNEQTNAFWSAFYACEGSFTDSAKAGLAAALALQPAMSGAVPAGIVLVSRDLLIAACSAIDKKRDAPNILGKMRTIAYAAPAAPIEAAQPASSSRPSKEWYAAKIAETLDDDFTIGPASSSAPADPMGSEAFKRYLKECDDGAISPDAAGAFHWAWMNRLSSALAVGAVAWVSPEQFHAHPDGGDDESGRYLPVRKSMVGKFTMPLFSAPSTGQDAAQAVDAARYRWLRNKSWAGYNQSKRKPQVAETIVFVADGAGNVKTILADDALDAAIDAALAAQGDRGTTA